MEKTVISLTEEEVTKVNVLQSGILQSLARLGEIEIEKLQLESIYKSLNEETDQLISRYNTLKENEGKKNVVISFLLHLIQMVCFYIFLKNLRNRLLNNLKINYFS